MNRFYAGKLHFSDYINENAKLVTQFDKHVCLLRKVHEEFKQKCASSFLLGTSTKDNIFYWNLPGMTVGDTMRKCMQAAPLP